MRTFAFTLLALAACGGIATPSEPDDCPVTPEAGVPEASPLDASQPPVLDASIPDAADASDAAKAPPWVRYTILSGDEVKDNLTGLTWYRRSLYGSLTAPQPDICSELPGGFSKPMRRPTVAEALTILTFLYNGEIQFGWPFNWSQAIASEASNGCINLPVYSVTDVCQGDLINRLCVRFP